ncbi:UNVERIFIED_CONTAM: hypothetical protein RMT77_005878 [Armadillidium vulgare]
MKYETHDWMAIGNFKIIAVLMGLQRGGVTKFSCYLYLWDSRDTTTHYHKKHWTEMTEFCLGKHNVKFNQFIYTQNVLFSPLPIKLGLIKQFIEALNKEFADFKYLKGFFPKLSVAKVKAGVFARQQFKKIIKSSEFQKKLSGKEVLAIEVIKDFLFNHKAENYVELVETLVKTYSQVG